MASPIGAAAGIHSAFRPDMAGVDAAALGSLSRHRTAVLLLPMKIRRVRR